MDSFEVNKILGAILGTLTFTLAISIGATLIFENNKPPAKAGFEIAVPKTAANGAAPAAPKVEPIANRLAKADPKKGEALTKQCQSCHNFQKGQGPKVGPDLYGVVGEEIAKGQGFSFSAALKKLASAHHVWTFQLLDEWLTSPSTLAPGTAMSFAGIDRPQQRADVIAYLNQNSAKPEPLPKPVPVAAAPAAGAASAAGAAPPAKPSFATMVAQADPAKGEGRTAVCKACHNFKEGQGKKVGPDLYGVVGRPIASQNGFPYTAALKKLAAKEKVWTVDNLNTWLENPGKDAPGTAMTFAGISSEKQRAEVVAYLNHNSDHPVSLPKSEAAAPSKENPAPSDAQPTPPKATPPAAGGSSGASSGTPPVQPDEPKPGSGGTTTQPQH